MKFISVFRECTWVLKQWIFRKRFKLLTKMNLSWWWCKHFSSVYLPIITFFLLCTSSCSSATGDEPTEKAEETIKHTSATTITTGEPTILTNSEGIIGSVVDSTSSEATVVNPNINLSEKHDDDELQARALFRSSGKNYYIQKLSNAHIRVLKSTCLNLLWSTS